MTSPYLLRLVALVVAVWIVVGVIALVLFHWGGAHPPTSGRGEPIAQLDTP